VTVGICLIAALLLLLEGYFGYSGVLLAVGAAAAVNLLYAVRTGPADNGHRGRWRVSLAWTIEGGAFPVSR
jgi:hypothetical protein